MPRLDRLLACFCGGANVAGGVEVIKASPDIAVQPGIPHKINMAHARAPVVMDLVDEGPIHPNRVTLSKQERPAAHARHRERCAIAASPATALKTRPIKFSRKSIGTLLDCTDGMAGRCVKCSVSNPLWRPSSTFSATPCFL